MDGFRKENNQFIADLATIYQCRQEKPEILAQAKNSITFEDLAQKLQDKLDAERKQYSLDIQGMKDEMAGLQDQLDKANEKLKALEANKPTEIITTEQVKSVIDRILDWLKGRSK
jgi:Skp family chaperone for outer membrane proteins